MDQTQLARREAGTQRRADGIDKWTIDPCTYLQKESRSFLFPKERRINDMPMTPAKKKTKHNQKHDGGQPHHGQWAYLGKTIAIEEQNKNNNKTRINIKAIERTSRS
mmetsp:Transcript_66833/g.139553  ORF Transcript_66833/g.139553 Transcript_66833/m.139553 type:complete len:107 (+) Transcript_66833:177-497(+)